MMFTYEASDKRETYEWDNVWWEHASEDDTPRLLLNCRRSDKRAWRTRSLIVSSTAPIRRIQQLEYGKHKRYIESKQAILKLNISLYNA